MSETVVLTVPFTAGITQAEAEAAILQLTETKLREALVEIAAVSTSLSSNMRAFAGREIDGENAATMLANIDHAIDVLQRQRYKIVNRFEARAALMERVDGSPNLELMRAG